MLGTWTRLTSTAVLLGALLSAFGTKAAERAISPVQIHYPKASAAYTHEAHDRRSLESSYSSTAPVQELEEIAAAVGAALEHNPSKPVPVRLMDRKDFRNHASVPSWATGVFLRGEILLPLADSPHGKDEMMRTFRHEFAHAVIESVSRGRCPAWFDEGLAQFLEGPTSEVLERGLRDLSAAKLRPLHQLFKNVTQVKREDARLAYAQSYLAVQFLVQNRGLESVRRYLRLLSAGTVADKAFQTAFAMTPSDLESALQLDLSEGHSALSVPVSEIAPTPAHSQISSPSEGRANQ